MIPVELGAGAFGIVLTLGILCGAASMFVLRKRVSQADFRVAVNRIWAHLLEFQLFAEEPALILKAQRDLLIANARMLRILFAPSLIIALPLVVILVGMEALFGHAPLPPGATTVVTIQYRAPSGTALPDATIEPPSGIEVDTPAVRIPSESQMSWRVRAVRSASGVLRILTPRGEFTKSISAGPGLHWLSTLRAFSGLSLLLRPQELPLPWGSLQRIEIRYPAATVFHFHWTVWFAVSSLLGGVVMWGAPRSPSRWVLQP